MKLPNRDRATVADVKILDYLLSSTHPVGRPKAEFFARFGFTRYNWGVLARALSEHAREQEIVEQSPSPWGTKYVVEGPLRSPDGRSPRVRTVWLVEAEDGGPRLITAYPA